MDDLTLEDALGVLEDTHAGDGRAEEALRVVREALADGRDLIGNAEAAELLGVKTSNVGKVAGLTPWAEPRGGRIYRRRDVLAAVQRRHERSVGAAR